jgi:hypothetical protein
MYLDLTDIKYHHQQIISQWQLKVGFPRSPKIVTTLLLKPQETAGTQQCLQKADFPQDCSLPPLS